MSEDWDAIAAEVSEALGAIGDTPAFLVEETVSGGTAFDPGTKTEVETAVNAIIMDYTSREVDNSVIQVGDRKVLASAPVGLDLPTTKTQFRFKPAGEAEETFQIMDVKVLQPAGPGAAALVLELQVRK